MTEELTSLSAGCLLELMRKREVSPVEVVEAHLRRADSLNPRLNAVVTLAPDALELARAAESKLQKSGELGSLFGLPLTVKDTIETRDLRTTFGSPLHANYLPKADAHAVGRLRAAGAIILGKTNASEMALDYVTENPLFGRTLNPHDPSLTPGGSSGGCAAAVSAGLTPASLGSDMSGSVRIPAHFCGIAGLKPTAGRVPASGHLPPLAGPFALGASMGPLARSVEDLSILYDVLSAGSLLMNSAIDSVVELLEVKSDSLRGTCAAWYADDGVVPVTEETRVAVKNVARALVDAGLEVSEALPPGVERGNELWLSLFTLPTQQFVKNAYDGREDVAGPVARIIMERARRSSAVTAAEYFERWTERDRVRQELLNWMETVPLLIAPVGSVPAFSHDAHRRFVIGEKEISTFRAFGYAQAFNVFDLPVVTVPAGRTEAGLPLGVQIIGRPHEEMHVLAAAYVVEKALGANPHP